MQGKPRVAFVGFGGTVSSLGTGPLDLVNYGDTKIIMQAGDILDRLPELREVADIVAVPFRNIAAIDVTQADWLALARKLDEIAHAMPDLAGIVVTHGTASLDETAYFLNLTLKLAIPVVLVGAQRPFSAISSDAQLNLINAARVAACPEARGMGVLVVMNDEIQAARDVIKTDTYRLQSFTSPALGALGYADADRISFYRAPTRAHTTATPFDAAGLAALPRVDIVTSYIGADATLIEAVVRAGARGIVAAGFAPGFCSPREVDALKQAVAQGIVVVQASRAHAGRVDPRARIRAAQFVAADNLPAHKARILLSLGLTRTSDREEIQDMFLTY